jgi:hypothetical protein
MGPVRRREGVVDIEIAELRQLLNEGRIVLLLTRVEAGVFEKKHIAVLERADGLGGAFADAVIGEGHGLVEMLRNRFRDRLQGFLGIASLRASEMGEKDHLSALVGDFLDGGKHALDARRVRHPAVLHRDVEVHPDENAFSLDLCLVERAEGGHEAASLR